MSRNVIRKIRHGNGTVKLDLDVFALKPHLQVPISTSLRTQANIPTAAVALITEPEQAEHNFANGEVDAVFLSSAMFRN
jgi:2,4-dienoyl-CoA reductase-like NADH-dependent reductase (Old Yellow Enzyme family)